MRTLFCVVTLAACQPTGMFDCTPTPWRSEVWLDDARLGRVVAELREGCGSFPDVDTEYRIVLHRRDGTTELLLEGGVEHFNRRHAITRTGSRVEIAVWDQACTIENGRATCGRIDYMRWP